MQVVTDCVSCGLYHSGSQSAVLKVQEDQPHRRHLGA